MCMINKLCKLVIKTFVLGRWCLDFFPPQLVPFVRKFHQAVGLEAGLSKRMANRSTSGPAHFSRPSILKESVYKDRHVWSKVHRENQEQSLQRHNQELVPPPHKERSATNTI